MGRMRGRPNRERSVLSFMTSSFTQLTEAQTTIIRVENLIAKKDTEYPKDTARNVSDSAQDPVTTRAGNPGCVRIRELCNSIRVNSIQQNTTVNKNAEKARNSLDQDTNGIGVEERLKRHVGNNEERK